MKVAVVAFLVGLLFAHSPRTALGDTATSGDALKAKLAAYPRYDQIVARMEDAVRRHPDFLKTVDVTKATGQPATTEGRHIVGVQVSAPGSTGERSMALIDGGLHGWEIGAPLVALETLDGLAEGYGNNERVTAALNKTDVLIVPVWNPDGYEFVFTGDPFWRGNRNLAAGKAGVDLNRNFPFGWDTCGGRREPTSIEYRGPSPLSEIESKTMAALAEAMPVEKVVDLHSPGRLVIYGHSPNCGTLPLNSFLGDEARAISGETKYEATNPPIGGTAFDFHLSKYGAFSFVFELTNDWQPLHDDAIAEAKLIWPAILRFLERPISVQGYVRDANSRAPILGEASLIVDGSRVHLGATRKSGRFGFILPGGIQTLQVSAPGYPDKTVVVGVTASSQETIEVLLAPATPDRTAGCSRAGCSTATGVPSGGAALAVLVLLVGFGRRRRAAGQRARHEPQ